jgi:hypothetical protein
MARPEMNFVLQTTWHSHSLSLASQDKFFTQLKSTPDAFNVIAEYFGRGILNAR